MWYTVLVHVISDPLKVVSDPGEYSWSSQATASVSPRHNTNQEPGGDIILPSHQRSTTVTMTSVLPLLTTSAEVGFKAVVLLYIINKVSKFLSSSPEVTTDVELSFVSLSPPLNTFIITNGWHPKLLLLTAGHISYFRQTPIFVTFKAPANHNSGQVIVIVAMVRLTESTEAVPEETVLTSGQKYRRTYGGRQTGLTKSL